jgi:glutathione S-transferase/alpha,alpha-trehalase
MSTLSTNGRNNFSDNRNKQQSNSLMLYGHPGSRSPLINWAALELNVDMTMGDLVDNPHPFGKLPCMTDLQGEIGIFESGAILQYLQDNFYDNRNNPLSAAQAAAVASWIVWANASLEPICLLSAEDGSIKGTSLQEQERQRGNGRSRSKNLKEIDRLDEILRNLSDDQQLSTSSSSAYLLGDEFTLADVAVASYLLFALRFFPETDLSIWPNIVAYMITCASREAYGEAFGRDIQASLLNTLRAMDSNRYSDRSINRGRRSSNSLTLYGHPSSMSPVVNWACFELGLDLIMGDLARNPHPFGKIPCLTDNEGEIMVFESGAILQYLLDNYQNDVANMNMNEFRRPAGSSAKESAQISSWIVWANAQLEPICCSDETATRQRSQRQRSPSSPLGFYDRPGVKLEPLDELNDLLGQKRGQHREEYYSPFLVGDKFTLADVAVASYLLYIPQNFPETNMEHWPHLISYMKDCTRRQGFSAAFGINVQDLVLDQLDYSFRNAGGSNGRRGDSLPGRRVERGYSNGRPDNYEDDVRRNIGNMGNGRLFAPNAY